MIYTHENCMPGTKVIDCQGGRIRSIVALDMDAAKVRVHGDPRRLNAQRISVIETTLSFERIEISKRCPLSNLPKEFRCFGRIQ